MDYYSILYTIVFADMTWTSSELLNQLQLQKVYLLRSTGEVKGWGMATTCNYFGPVIATCVWVFMGYSKHGIMQ
jgi:hypothetical protein